MHNEISAAGRYDFSFFKFYRPYAGGHSVGRMHIHPGNAVGPERSAARYTEPRTAIHRSNSPSDDESRGERHPEERLHTFCFRRSRSATRLRRDGCGSHIEQFIFRFLWKRKLVWQFDRDRNSELG